MREPADVLHKLVVVQRSLPWAILGELLIYLSVDVTSDCVDLGHGVATHVFEVTFEVSGETLA